MRDFGQQITVTVEPDGEGALNLLIDIDVLTQAFVAAHSCNQGAACGGLPWCISNFSQGLFTGAAPSFLGFD